MRFEFASGRGETVLRAIFEESDQHEGSRQEGPGTPITYSGEDIRFDYQVGSIHPDLLGLLCLIIFYPFIGERVVFPAAVSPRLERAFRNENFKRQFRFDNVDPAIEAHTGSRMALAFGGGVDSSALRVLFPDAFVVHEAHVRKGSLVPFHSHRVVRDIGSDRGRLVTTNQRYVSEPGGWHGWTCAFATSLLTATDDDFGIILMGSTLGTTLLGNGTRYWDRFRARDWHGPTGNFWQSAFDEVGLPVFAPLCGASTFLTMTLALDLLRAGDVFYCMETDGGACGRCSKCLRRDIVRAVVDPEHIPDWDPYDRPGIHAVLEQDPLRQGHVFSFARGRVEGLPRFLSSRIRHLPKIRTEWPMRVHAGTFDFCDERWRGATRERVLDRLDPMRPEQVAEMQGWDSTRRVPRRARAWNRLRAAGSRTGAAPAG